VARQRHRLRPGDEVAVFTNLGGCFRRNLRGTIMTVSTRLRRGERVIVLLDPGTPDGYVVLDLGIDFHGAIYRLRRAGWIIESRYIQRGQCEYRLTGQTTPPTADRHMNQTELRIALAYTTAIRDALGTTSLEEVLALLPQWMTRSAPTAERTSVVCGLLRRHDR
jgi:hypothetical protein